MESVEIALVTLMKIKHELGIIKSKIAVVLLIIAQIKLQYAHT